MTPLRASLYHPETPTPTGATVAQLDAFDKALIDKHFQSEELPRRYSPSGIYLHVQHFIDNGLEDARKRHDGRCEHRAGNPYGCRCQERAGYDYETLADGSTLMKPRPVLGLLSQEEKP